MNAESTLYKIQRNTALDHAIILETFTARSVESPHLLFCGGFHSDMLGNKANYLSKLASAKGWGFTRFDYQGHGQSGGLAENCSLHDWLGDVLAVLDSLSSQVILVGSSMGAWLSVLACLQRPMKIQGLLTIAAAPDFTHKLLWPALSNEQKKLLQEDQCITVPTRYEGEDWRIRARLFESGKELALLNGTSALNIRVPIRMLHGTADVDVPWNLSEQLMQGFTQSSDASLTLIAGADHRLSDDNGLQHITAALENLISQTQSI